tara:strand:+ start:580 stop:1071 length:492 start_codon:yes stop_codon:yes gene_type:complete
MANIHLTASVSNTEKGAVVSKSNVMRLAWMFVRTEGVKLSYALKRAWREASEGSLERNFWTNATSEDVDFMIKSCSRKGKVLAEKIRKWDSVENQHPLDWVAYQLRRQGFQVTGVKNDTIVRREVSTLNINALKTPKGFDSSNYMNLSTNGLTYCMKGAYICS